MRLRICCCYCTDEGPTCTETKNSNGSTLPRVVAEQPKRRQSIRLVKSADESAVQRKEDKAPVQQEVVPDKRFGDIEPAAEAQGIESYTLPDTASVPATSDVEEVQEAIPQSEHTSGDVVTSDDDELEEQRNEVARVTTEQSQSTVTFNVVAPGHLQSVYKGLEFHIVNGEIQSVNGACDESDKEFMIAQYASAMSGVERAMAGLEKGLLGMGRQMNGLQPTGPNVHSILAALHQPPRPPSPPRRANANITREDFQKFVNMLKDEVRKDEENKARDTTDSVDELGGYMSEPALEKTGRGRKDEENKARDTTDSVDELDGYISEPALEKTTFTPNEVVYEDPKTYEKLDSHEVPDAKRFDEYIISRDERLASGNAFYFHTARPKRARRKALDRKQMLQLASPERYTLFESECLKVHNKYRSMHGVPPLVNNTFLCKVAREWAEHLALNDAFYHRPKNEYGENLYKGDGLFVCARNSVAAWYDEIELYDYKNPKYEAATGHFTQLIWKDTREMGTGVAQIGKMVWVCCNYHPPGNHLDKFNEEYIPRPVVMPRKS